MAKITRASPGCDFSKPPGAPQFSLAVPAGAVFGGGCCQLSAGAPPAPEPYTTHLDKEVSKPLTRRVVLLHLFLSSAPQPDHCSQGGEKDLIILSLSHLSPPGDFLPLSFPSLKAARSGLGLLLISAQDQPSDSPQIHRVWGLRIQPPVGSLCLNDLL